MISQHKVAFVFPVSISTGIKEQKTISAFKRAIEQTMNAAMDCAIRVVIKPGALFKTLNGCGIEVFALE